jgi:hypothetical protein
MTGESINKGEPVVYDPLGKNDMISSYRHYNKDMLAVCMKNGRGM